MAYTKTEITASFSDWDTGVTPSMGYTSDGYLHAVVFDNSGNDTKFFYSDDDGATWTDGGFATPENFATGTDTAMVIDDEDNIYVFHARGLTVHTFSAGTYTQQAFNSGITTAGDFVSDMIVIPYGGDHYVFVATNDPGSGVDCYVIKVETSVSYGLSLNSSIGIDSGAQTDQANDHRLFWRHDGTGRSFASGETTPYVWFLAVDDDSNVIRLYRLNPSGTPTWSSQLRVSDMGTPYEERFALSAYDHVNKVIYVAGMDSQVSLDNVQFSKVDISTTTESLTDNLDDINLNSNNYRGIHMIYDHDDTIIALFEGTGSGGDGVFRMDYSISGDLWSSPIDQNDADEADTLRWGYGDPYVADSGGRVHHVMQFNSTDGTIDYVEVERVNQPPSATIISPVDGVNADVDSALEIDWTVSDPDGDPQTKYSVKRVLDAVTTEYWNGSEWVSSESGSTEITSTSTSVAFEAGWADASTTTSIDYSVKVSDANGFGDYSTAVTIFPTTTVATNRGFALPRPIKKQENIMAVLKSNNDYMLSWVNNYVPKYGDLNDDLYLKAGLRPGGESQMRDMFPPVVGEFDLGNGTNYFNAVGATNIYRTNELSLSSERAKEFLKPRQIEATSIIDAVPIETFKYKDSKMNRKMPKRFGIVAEDLEHVLIQAGLNPKHNSFIMYEDDTMYVNSEQLIGLLWRAVQELSEKVDELAPRGWDRRRFRKRNKNT